MQQNHENISAQIIPTNKRSQTRIYYPWINKIVFLNMYVMYIKNHIYHYNILHRLVQIDYEEKKARASATDKFSSP